MPSSSRQGDRSSMQAIDRPLATAEIMERAAARVKGLTRKDVVRVWGALGSFVQKQLQRGCSARVPHFGTFGRSTTASSVAFFVDPVFLQSNRLRDASHRNGVREVLADGPAPLVNMAQVGDELLKNCGGEVVQAVIANVVAHVGASAKEGRDVQLQMLPLGEWRCDRDVVSFRFSSDLQTRLAMPTDLSSVVEEKGSSSLWSPSALKEARCLGSSNQDELELSLASALSRAHSAKSVASNRSTSSTMKQSNGSISQRKNVQSRNGKLSHQSNTGSVRDSISFMSKRSSYTAASESNRSAPPSSLLKQSNQSATRSPKEMKKNASMRPEAKTLKKIIAMLVKRRGQNALNMLSRELERLGVVTSGNMSLLHLKQALLNLGVTVSIPTLDAVMSLVARKRDGSVPFNDFILAVRGGELSPLRSELIAHTFRSLGLNAAGVVEMSALRTKANQVDEDHPLVRFVHNWGLATKNVALDQFITYYHNISGCIADDNTFEQLLKETWLPILENQATSRELPAANQERASIIDLSNAEVSKTAQDDSQSEVSYLRQILCPSDEYSSRIPSIDDVSRKLGVNRIWGDGNETMNRTAFAHALGRLDRGLHSKDALHLSRLVATICGSEDVISLVKLHSRLVGTDPTVVSTMANSRNGANVSANSNVVDRVRSRIFSRIGRTQQCIDGDSTPNDSFLHQVGLNGLQRSLKLMDTNGDKTLTKDELKIGLHKFGVDVNYHEIDFLFTYFDADRSGCISANEFLVGMRGEMSTRRLKFVHQAFDLLDRDGSGQVTLDELFSIYDTTNHPDVMSGKLTADQAVQIFARQWESDKPDGVITKQEFETYYRNLSASIDSDDYFELMMRNAWHISGGEGQCSNTTIRRVLVSDSEGGQKITELENDLGMSFSELQRQAVIPKALNTAPGPSQPGSHKWTAPRAVHKVPAQEQQALSAKQLRPFHRRRMNLNKPLSEKAQRGISSNIFQTEDDMSDLTRGRQLGVERNLRERAAQLIQSRFRGFRGRRFVACVRRKIAFDTERKRMLEQEQQTARPKINRAALRTFHGF